MVYLEVLAVILLILLNGFLAMSELAVISSRKSRLEHMAKVGNKGAKNALKLLENPGRFLSTVQVGITLVGIIAGAYSGATLGVRLGTWLDAFPLISPYGIAIGIGVTVVCITYLSVVMGELVPKSIAFARPERIATIVAMPMHALSQVTRPAVWLLHLSTDGILRLLGIPNKRDITVTEEEVRSLIAEGIKTGVFIQQEKEMIDGVLRLADRPVRVIMTPRSRVAWVDARSDRDTILAMVEANRFSRLLICDGSIDKPLGVVNTKDLLPVAMRGGKINLADLITPLLYIPDRMPILTLLNRFRKEKVHIAAAIDEYGMINGRRHASHR